MLFVSTAQHLCSIGSLLKSCCKQPVFLRASHSPWCFIPQNVLVFFRGLILAYLIAASILVLNYETTDAAPGETNARLLFDFAIISGFMVLLYFIITFVGQMHKLVDLSQMSNVGLCDCSRGLSRTCTIRTPRRSMEASNHGL